MCHARRAGFHEEWLPGQWLSQTHVVEALARATYHADGQIRDVEEPYNYTPFKQSRMFAAGVTCSDCHEPHSGKLRVASEGVCLQCHAADKFADAKHRHHAVVDPPPTCISCHMQARTYMIVDQRHDHAFRIPRPDLSVNWARRTHATIAIPTSRRNGRLPPSKMVRPRPEGLSDLWVRLSMLRARTKPMPPLFSAFWPATERTSRCARERAWRTRVSRLARQHRHGSSRTCRSRSDGADRRPRHVGAFTPRPGLAIGFAAPVRSRARRAHQGSLRCSPQFRLQASRSQIAHASSRRRKNSSPRNALTPRGPKPAPRWRISSRSADKQSRPRLSTRLP